MALKKLVDVGEAFPVKRPRLGVARAIQFKP